MERKPDLLILADDYFVKTVEAGYNENYAKQVKSGRINVINLATANELCNRGEIKTISNPDGEVFVLNPYRQQYVSIEQSDLNGNFIDDQVWAITHALDLLGAHATFFSENIKDTGTCSREVRVKGGNSLSQAEIKAKSEKEDSEERAVRIRICNLENHPAQWSKIEDHLRKTGIYYTGPYQGWLDNLKMGRSLPQIFDLEIDYNSTLKSSFDLAATLNFRAFRADLSVDTIRTRIHSFKKTLKVYFGDVPQEVVDKINS